MIKAGETKVKRAYFSNSAVLEITGISNDRLQYFIRLGLVIPASPGFGRGKGHKYDILNIVRIGFLNELDSIGLETGTIKEVMEEASPKMLGFQGYEKEKGSQDAWRRILAIFRSGVAASINWFATPQKALTAFYSGNKPESREEEIPLINTLHSIILVDIRRLWKSLMFRLLNRVISDHVKFLERRRKRVAFEDPERLRVAKVIIEAQSLMSQGKYSAAFDVVTKLPLEVKEKTDKKPE